MNKIFSLGNLGRPSKEEGICKLRGDEKKVKKDTGPLDHKPYINKGRKG